MKIANISTIKNELSKYLRYVQQGERVRILDRNQAVADIIPVALNDESTTENQLQQLEQKGIIRRGTGEFPSELKTLSSKTSQVTSSGVLESLLNERNEDR